jgi:hypothetical protein
VLLPLNLREGRVRMGTLYLVYAEPRCGGSGVLRLADIIRATVRRSSRERATGTELIRGGSDQ